MKIKKRHKRYTMPLIVVFSVAFVATAIYLTYFYLIPREEALPSYQPSASYLKSPSPSSGVETGEPSSSPSPVDPSESLDPTASAEPSGHVEPSAPVEPSTSAKPTESVTPSESVLPVETLEPAVSPTPAPSLILELPPPEPKPVGALAERYTPVLTGDFSHSYEDDNIIVHMQTKTIGEGDNLVTYYVAEVMLDSMEYMKTALAKGKFGTNYVDKTSVMAKEVGAILAVNGDYYGDPNREGIIIRNGTLYRDQPKREGAALTADGRLIIYQETAGLAVELIEQHGVIHSFSFDVALVDKSVALDVSDSGLRPKNPRTGLGMIDPYHFLIITVDGRSPGYSEGLDIYDFADLFVTYGCESAYNLDGGGSATMVYEDELINSPLGTTKERSISDILYIGY